MKELGAFDENDPALEGDLYTFMGDIYRRLAKNAPSELEPDFALVISDLGSYAEWIKDTTQPQPLDDAEQQAFEDASNRIDTYMEKECGIAPDDTSTDTSAGVDTGGSGVDNGAYTASQTISVGGETYQETLNGDYEVSCDMYGDLETGSINIYLEGPEFQSSVSSYDSGVKPGTYGGQVWVFVTDSALEESIWDLQEIDGTFVLDGAENVSDGEWSFTGTFSGSVEDPPASIDATFSCVGLVDG